MNQFWQGKQPYVHKVKPLLSKPEPKFNSDNERVCPWEHHLGMMAWHATRQAYRQLLQRRRSGT